MDAQKFFDTVVAAGRHNRLQSSPQLTLNEIILKLKACNGKCNNGEEKQVYYDFCDFYPETLHSWRGSYSELATSYTDEDWSKAPTISKCISMFEDAIGKTYTGYKGGEYTMNKNTPVWVSNYGESKSTGIVEVLEADVCIILVTAYCEY